MNYKVRLTKKAADFLSNADKNLREKINNNLCDLINFYDGKSDHIPDVKLLQGKYEKILRLRVGNFRVIFKIEKQELIIIIIDIIARKDAYKR